MKGYEVTFKAELDLGGAPDEMVQKAAQAIKTGEAADPNTPVSKVEIMDGIVFCDFSMSVEATDEQDAIAKVKQYLDEQMEDASGITPWKIHSFKAKEAV